MDCGNLPNGISSIIANGCGMKINLHYILCQLTDETYFIQSPLYINVQNGYFFGGKIVPYYYRYKDKRPCSKLEILKLCAKAVFS